MADQQPGLPVPTRRHYRQHYALLLMISVLPATLLAVWVIRRFTLGEWAIWASHALSVAATLVAVGLSSLWLSRRLGQQNVTSLREPASLQLTQQRLLHQQSVWQHLRELNQQDISEAHFLQAIQISLKELLSISRTSIWYFDDPPGFATCRDSLDPDLVGTRRDMTSLKPYIERLNRAPFMETNHDQNAPRPSIMQGRLAESDGTSMIDVGIFVGGELRGSLCCETQQPRRWQPDEINALMGISGLLSQFAESLRRRAAEEDLYHQIHYDAVTGLPTLQAIDEALGKDSSQLDSFHVVILRVRGLNHINQSLGHGGGDEALRQVAAEIDRRLLSQRQAPRLARLPANQLAILLPGSPHDAWLEQRLGEMLVSLTEINWHIHGRPFQLHFAAGMAHYPEHGDHFEQVLQRAELATKRARHESLPLVQYAPQLSEWESRRLHTERELRVAIAEQQFRVFLQPQYDLSGNLRGAETLLRWQHPQRGLVAPGAFIGHAERSGLIRPIGYWVLEQAVELLAGPLAESEITLAVNVSIDQLRDDEFVTRVEALLERGGFEPRRLVLEIVESLLASPGMTVTLKALRKLGVQLALDDFGTGYSSLRYLQEFPVDEIKLDKVFLLPLQQAPDAPLARSIIGLAKTLQLRLVAEGIEASDQLEFMRRQHVDLIQGYLLAHPEPVTQFLARLDKQVA